MNIIKAMFKWVEEKERYQKSIQCCYDEIERYTKEIAQHEYSIKRCKDLVKYYKQRAAYLRRKEKNANNTKIKK